MDPSYALRLRYVFPILTPGITGPLCICVRPKFLPLHDILRANNIINGLRVLRGVCNYSRKQPLVMPVVLYTYFRLRCRKTARQDSLRLKNGYLPTTEETLLALFRHDQCSKASFRQETGRDSRQHFNS